jgi:hypothetical protein
MSPDFQELYAIYVVHRQKPYPPISKQITLAQERDHIHVAGKTASEHKNLLASDKKQSVISAPTQD